jgi:hypothetical protein
MEPLESAERAEAVSKPLESIGLDPELVEHWWHAPNVAFDRRSPAEAWAQGAHLAVEAMTARPCLAYHREARRGIHAALTQR